MLEVSVAEAKAKLSELLNKIEEGEQITITRWGKPVARILPFKLFLPFESHADLRSLQMFSSKRSIEHLHDMHNEDV